MGYEAGKEIGPKIAKSLNTLVNPYQQTEFLADKLSRAGFWLQPVGRSAFVQMIEHEHTLWIRLIEQRYISHLEGL